MQVVLGAVDVREQAAVAVAGDRVALEPHGRADGDEAVQERGGLGAVALDRPVRGDRLRRVDAEEPDALLVPPIETSRVSPSTMWVTTALPSAGGPLPGAGDAQAAASELAAASTTMVGRILTMSSGGGDGAGRREGEVGPDRGSSGARCAR